MKKESLIFLLCFSLAPTLSHAVEISFKLSSGLGFCQPESVNRALDDWLSWHKKSAAAQPDEQFLEGGVPSLSPTFDFEGELLVGVSKRIFFGLSTGFWFADAPQSKAEARISRPGGTYAEVHPIQLSIYPLLLSGYYHLPVYTSLSLFGKAGVGWLFAQYVERTGSGLAEEESFSYSIHNTASAVSLTAVAGVGINFQLEESVGLFFETLYRHALISGFSGQKKNKKTGALYQYEEYDPELDFWVFQLRIHANAPSENNRRNIKQAEIDLSGLTVKIGLKIRF